MNSSTLRITPSDTAPVSDDRFDRFREISWWDQDRLSRAKVLVVGAGALGNEIIKNLALLGVGNILIVDLDRVENSNLSRSVLFREAHQGRLKAEVAAHAARDIYPAGNYRAFHGDVIHDLGLGAYAWADVILGGLDNREARLAINRAAWKVGKPWIDGAIEQIQGCARVFAPDGPCYECTMSQLDWQLIARRRSCNLLTAAEMRAGRTPTTPTIGSMIAGLQCQEAVKLLHGLPAITGRGWVFDGLSCEGYQVEYQRKPDCYSHETLEEIVPVRASAASITARDLLAYARDLIGPSAELEFARDSAQALTCPICHESTEVFCAPSRLSVAKLECPNCAAKLEHPVRRELVTFYKLRGGEAFLDRPLAAIGVPALDIVFARSAARLIGLLLADDAANVLGTPLSNSEDLAWI